MNLVQPVSAAASFLSGGGQLGQLITEFEWASTSLGPIEDWPQVVKTTVGLILRSPVPIVTLWGDSGVMIYNDAYSEFAGGRHPQLLGSKVREGWPEVADFNDNVMKTVFERGETLSYQDQELTLYRNGRGEQVWMNLDYSQVVQEDGSPAGVIAIVVETTGKVDAERRLSGERERLRQMFDEAPGFMALLEGPDHRFVMTNRAYVALVEGREVLGKTVAEALPEATEQGFVSLLDTVYSSGEPFTGRATPVLLNGSGGAEGRFVDFIFQPITGHDGALSGIFVQGHDVTERQRALKAIEESEERFRLVAERAPVMLWMGDAAGRCLYLNKAQRDFWGVDFDDFQRFDWGTTVHPDDSGSLYERFSVAMAEHIPFTVTARYRRSDGTYRLIETHAEPRLGADGEFLGMIGVNVDITEVREAQSRLEELNATLEARVIEEIGERRAAEAALQQAQKMESIGKLTGGVAHDFNNLLQIISGNLQLLQMNMSADDKNQRRIANALAGVERGAKLASQLLAFGRRQPLEPKVVDVGRLVAGMEDLLRRSIGEAVEIAVRVEPSLWKAYVDPTQVENALLNLAINARDAMNGVGTLTVTLANFELEAGAAEVAGTDPGDYVMLAVADTGTGMQSDVLERAFEPFFTTKAEGKGSGLGLSMVYGFVKQSGGHVTIESAPGRGTTVRLYLPRIDEEESDIAIADQGRAVGGSETILVVEDDEEVRTTVTDMLSELGYRVIAASDATSAMDLIDGGAEVDLLFTDVVMPGPMRSPDLARRAREKLPSLEVLFTSGYTEDSIVHGGRVDPGVDLLAKPYTRQALATRVRSALDRRGSA